MASLGLQSNITTKVSGLQRKYQGFNGVIILLKILRNLLCPKYWIELPDVVIVAGWGETYNTSIEDILMEVCFILQYIHTGYTHGGMLHLTICPYMISSWRYASSYNTSIQDILMEVNLILQYVHTGYTHGGKLHLTICPYRIYSWR